MIRKSIAGDPRPSRHLRIDGPRHRRRGRPDQHVTCTRALVRIDSHLRDNFSYDQLLSPAALMRRHEPAMWSAGDSVMKLNLGCGPVHAANWVNVDGSNRAWLASRLPWLDRLLVAAGLIAPTEFNERTVFAPLLRRFPWKNASADAIYMGEILEHFTQKDGERVLSECYRVLKPGGLLRVRVPDRARFWKQYVEEFERTKSKPRAQWNLDHTRWTAMYFRDVPVRRPRLWQSMGHFHKWMSDEVSLIHLFESMGFERAERRALHQSGISQIEDVEIRDDLIVEGTRPYSLTPSGESVQGPR